MRHNTQSYSSCMKSKRCWNKHDENEQYRIRTWIHLWRRNTLQAVLLKHLAVFFVCTINEFKNYYRSNKILMILYFYDVIRIDYEKMKWYVCYVCKYAKSTVNVKQFTFVEKTGNLIVTIIWSAVYTFLIVSISRFKIRYCQSRLNDRYKK